jgi:hypothetical protein
MNLRPSIVVLLALYALALAGCVSYRTALREMGEKHRAALAAPYESIQP